MCTRAVYTGSNDLVITGRTMDWPEDQHSNAWLFPRGMIRNGAAGARSVRWTSRFGSLVMSTYDAASSDGMNERGLVCNGLYLAESDYGAPDGRSPTLSIMAYLQYVLDNFSCVAEVVEGLRAHPLQITVPILPNGKPATCHLSVSDPTGDSAIFEYLDGQLVIHHGKQYRVLTNSPSYDRQLAINGYWEGIDPLTFLPGSINAADRFARASFLISAIPTRLDANTISAVPDGCYENQALASVLGVMRAISVPLGIVNSAKPNLSSTLWRTAWDHKRKVFWFDSATSPNAFWVPLSDLDFSPGAPVKKLTLAGGRVYAGNTASQFEPAAAFEFMAAEP
jgi:choloylglycine hydrolase